MPLKTPAGTLIFRVTDLLLAEVMPDGSIRWIEMEPAEEPDAHFANRSAGQVTRRLRERLERAERRERDRKAKASSGR